MQLTFKKKNNRMLRALRVQFVELKLFTIVLLRGHNSPISNVGPYLCNLYFYLIYIYIYHFLPLLFNVLEAHELFLVVNVFVSPLGRKTFSYLCKPKGPFGYVKGCMTNKMNTSFRSIWVCADKVGEGRTRVEFP